MQGILYQSKIIHKQLDDDLYMSEFLFFPELCQLGKKEKNTANLRKLIQRVVQQGNPLHLYQKQLPLETEIQTLSVDLKAPKNSLENIPLQFSLQGLQWELPGNGRSCYIPGLGVQVVCSDKKKDFAAVIKK